MCTGRVCPSVLVTLVDPCTSWEPTTGADVQHYLDNIKKRRSYTGIPPTWRASCECFWVSAWVHSPDDALDLHTRHQLAHTAPVK